MKILILSPQSSGVGHYRFDIPLSAMKDLEIRRLHADDFGTYGEHFEKNVLELVSNFKPDVIHVGYLTDSITVGKLAGLREYVHAPIITDIDDDILHVPAYNIAYPAYHGGGQGKKVTRMHLRISDAVSVSTPSLSTVLSSDCRSTHVLPNCLRVSDWETQVSPSTSNFIRILFSGNLGRYGDLLVVKEALEKLMQFRENVQLFFVGCTPDWVGQWMSDNKNPHANRAFSINPCGIHLYMPLLQRLSPEIILSPVEENEFNKSKSHIKAYDAAMTGAAFICTDWPTYESVPNNGAIKVSNNTTQWYESLCALVDDIALRNKLAVELKTWALDSWTIDKHVHKWLDLYHEVASAGPITSIDQIVRPA